MTCEQCGKQNVTVAHRTTDGRFICDHCLRATAVWPVSRSGSSGGNLYPPTKAL